MNRLQKFIAYLIETTALAGVSKYTKTYPVPPLIDIHTEYLILKKKIAIL